MTNEERIDLPVHDDKVKAAEAASLFEAHQIQHITEGARHV